MGCSSSIQAARGDEVVAADLPFPKDGVKLGGFDEFIKRAGGEVKLLDLTTTDVCNQFLKPLTLESEGSYCDVLRQENSPDVGVAHLFISHAWRYKFLDVVNAIKHHLKDNKDTIIWFDLFSNNQHRASSLPYEWWSTTFKSAIAQFGHTVLVLSPWDNPIPFTRAWCLFEVYCSIETKSKVEVAMSENEMKEFRETIRYDTAAYNNMLAKIDVQKSEAWNPDDKKRIFRTVEKSVGFQEVNTKVMERMRDWVLSTAEEGVEQADSWEEEMRNKMALAGLYHQQGKYDKAEPLYVECLAKTKAKLGDDHPSTLASIKNLAGLYHQQGKYEKAEPLYVECLEKRKAKLGDDHPDTLSSMFSLASLYGDKKQIDKAKQLYTEAITRGIRRNHPSVEQWKRNYEIDVGCSFD